MQPRGISRGRVSATNLNIPLSSRTGRQVPSRESMPYGELIMTSESILWSISEPVGHTCSDRTGSVRHSNVYSFSIYFCYTIQTAPLAEEKIRNRTQIDNLPMAHLVATFLKAVWLTLSGD